MNFRNIASNLSCPSLIASSCRLRSSNSSACVRSKSAPDVCAVSPFLWLARERSCCPSCSVTFEKSLPRGEVKVGEVVSALAGFLLVPDDPSSSTRVRSADAPRLVISASPGPISSSRSWMSEPIPCADSNRLAIIVSEVEPRKPLYEAASAIERLSREEPPTLAMLVLCHSSEPDRLSIAHSCPKVAIDIAPTRKSPAISGRTSELRASEAIRFSGYSEYKRLTVTRIARTFRRCNACALNTQDKGEMTTKATILSLLDVSQRDFNEHSGEVKICLRWQIEEDAICLDTFDCTNGALE